MRPPWHALAASTLPNTATPPHHRHQLAGFKHFHYIRIRPSAGWFASAPEGEQKPPSVCGLGSTSGPRPALLCDSQASVSSATLLPPPALFSPSCEANVWMLRLAARLPGMHRGGPAAPPTR